MYWNKKSVQIVKQFVNRNLPATFTLPKNQESDENLMFIEKVHTIAEIRSLHGLFESGSHRALFLATRPWRGGACLISARVAWAISWNYYPEFHLAFYLNKSFFLYRIKTNLYICIFTFSKRKARFPVWRNKSNCQTFFIFIKILWKIKKKKKKGGIVTHSYCYLPRVLMQTWWYIVKVFIQCFSFKQNSRFFH